MGLILRKTVNPRGALVEKEDLVLYNDAKTRRVAITRLIPFDRLQILRAPEGLPPSPPG